MNVKPNILQKPMYIHLFFWLMVTLCYAASNWDYFEGINEVLVTYVPKVGLQAIVAYLILGYIFPRYSLDHNTTLLALSLLLLLVMLHLVVTTWRQLYLIPTFQSTYSECIIKYGHLSFWQHIFSVETIIFRNIGTYFPPTFILISLQYYDTLYRKATLSDMRKTQELNSLKRQLNPHFLFNTLNNLYALSLKKSDNAPDIVARLADIMDYMLYRCEEEFVSLDKEIELIDNYLALEKLRFGTRVKVVFKKEINAKLKIAPLLLLTFIENAFKHGVAQESTTASIDIFLIARIEEIEFRIINTKPVRIINVTDVDVDIGSRKPIGLDNIKRQLENLYGDAHELVIDEDERTFEMKLKLKGYEF